MRGFSVIEKSVVSMTASITPFGPSGSEGNGGGSVKLGLVKNVGYGWLNEMWGGESQQTVHRCYYRRSSFPLGCMSSTNSATEIGVLLQLFGFFVLAFSQGLVC